MVGYKVRMVELLDIQVRILLFLLIFNVLFSIMKSELSSSARSKKAMLHEKKANDLVKSMLFLVVSKSQFSQLSPRLCETNNWILFKDLFVPVWLRTIKSGSFLKTFLN